MIWFDCYICLCQLFYKHIRIFFSLWNGEGVFFFDKLFSALRSSVNKRIDKIRNFYKLKLLSAFFGHAIIAMNFIQFTSWFSLLKHKFSTILIKIKLTKSTERFRILKVHPSNTSCLRCYEINKICQFKKKK